MKPARIVGMINAAALGTISTDEIRELLELSLPALLLARKRLAQDRRRTPVVLPTRRLIVALHATLHEPLSQELPAEPLTHAMT